jgi:hypothetical protein
MLPTVATAFGAFPLFTGTAGPSIRCGVRRRLDRQASPIEHRPVPQV